MKKTVSVNLAGISFVMDEDAYAVLRAYLDDIARRLDPECREETLSDIESRIAELFRDNGTGDIRVVEIGLVRKVMDIIGSPALFGERPGETPSKERPPLRRPWCDRKLMRDPDHAVLGGVCSGLAAYMGCDTAVIRLVTVLLFLFGTLSLWVYIILWIVIPVPRTPADREIMAAMKNRI